MNQHIKGLATQAGMEYMFHNNKSNTPGMCSPDSLKEFAELIVRECAKVINEELYCDESPIANKMKKHFRVEE